MKAADQRARSAAQERDLTRALKLSVGVVEDGERNMRRASLLVTLGLSAGVPEDELMERVRRSLIAIPVVESVTVDWLEEL